MGNLNSSHKYWHQWINPPNWIIKDKVSGWFSCLVCKYTFADGNIDKHITCNPIMKLSLTKGDMKEGLTNGKPQLSQLPQAGLVYTTRAFEYGCSPTKYERGNYLRPTLDTLADFDRLLSYLDALLRHATKITTEMNRARGCTDQTETDLRAAAMCIDKESGLPHLCGMMASGMMAIQQAADAGLIPADPGRPWDKKNQKLTS
jgi:hypothetical protein